MNNKKSLPKFIQMNWHFIKDKDTTLQEKILLVEIFNLSKKQKCSASNKHFSERLNIKKSSVSRSLSNLENKNYILTEIVPNTRNTQRDISINNGLKWGNNGLMPINNLLNTPLTMGYESKENIEDINIEKNIKTIFEHWQTTLNKSRSKMNETRKRLITKSLKEFTVDELIKAINGNKKSDYHQANKYNGIDLIFRNADKIEFFIGKNEVTQNETHINNRKLSNAEQNEFAISELLRKAKAGIR